MEIVYCLKGNEPLLLDDPEKVWVVKTGVVAVFITTVREGLPTGNRRYLFTVNPGEVLFSSRTDAKQRGFLAIAIEATELCQITLSDWVARKSSAIAEFTDWVNRLNRSVISQNSETDLSRYLTDINLEYSTNFFNHLASLHADFFQNLILIEQEENEAAFRQFQEREQLDRQLVENALGKLASALPMRNRDATFSGSQVHFSITNPLLIAAGAVGRAMGITINPPAQSEDLSRVKDPVEAIARASQIRARRIVLEEGWWRKEYGPLLTYTREEKRPVALLPAAGNRYWVFDPVTRSQTPVDVTVAATLTWEAYLFYRPFPKIVDKAIQLFFFGTQGYEKDIAKVLVIGIVGTLLGMVVPQATAILVDRIIPDGDRNLLGQIGLALLAVAFGQSAFQMAQGITALRVESAANSVLQMAMWDRLLKLSPAFFRQFTSGDLVNRATTINQIRQQLSGATQRTLLSGIFALLNLVLMFIYSWQLALVGVGIALIAAIVTMVAGFLLVSKSRRQQALEGELSGLTVQLINGVAKLRVAKAETRAFAAWADRYGDRIKLKAESQQISDRISVFNEALPLITSVLLFWFAILSIQRAQIAEVASSGLTAGIFLAFNAALGIFMKGVTDLSNTLISILGIVPLWERAVPILQAEPEYNLSKANPGRLIGRVILDHITFRYREDGLPILNDVSLAAEPGEFVAIVGPSGSGKSTLLRLLLGFETPLSGNVYYDGKDLAGLDLQAVRRQLGVVLQNSRIASGSIFDNISGGALVSLEEAWEAAQMAGLAADIEQMPMGIHTVISEGGTNLSGGQRQRLLIARALVLKPKIILLDEATSSLDNRTQAIVTESLDKLKATRIVIAHRLSTIRHANRIYVLEAGRIVQVGRFEDLVQQEGLFARLVARQME